MSEDYVCQCCDKAADCIARGDYDTAGKYLKKATGRDPSNSRAIELLSILATRKIQEEKQPSTSEPGVRFRNNTKPEETTNACDYSPDDKKLADYINSKSDYYEILGIEQSATSSDIKKAYRKIAKDTHPDKNKAPGAEEAFKRVAAAYSTLSDEEKRRDYDTRPKSAGDNVFGGSQSPAPYAAQYSNFSTVDADDIFRMFFGGDPFMGGGRTVYRTYGGNMFNQTFYTNRAAHTEENVPPPTGLRRFLPLIGLVFYMLIMFFMNSQSTPVYSVSETKIHTVKRTQPETNVLYYVTPSFDGSRRNVLSVEKDVLGEYYSNYRYWCIQDLQNEGRKKERRQEKDIPNCVLYRRIQTVLGEKYGGVPPSKGNNFFYAF